MTGLTTLDILYIVLITFFSVIWVLLTIVLIKLIKILKVAQEVTDYYYTVKEYLAMFERIPGIIKDKILDIITWDKK